MSNTEKSKNIQLQALIDSVPGVVYEYYHNLKTNEMKFNFISAGVQEIFEVDSATALKDIYAVFQRIHPDDVARISEEVHRAVSDFNSIHQVYRVVLPEKGVRWLTANLQCTKGSRDDLVILRGLITDITETKQKEERTLQVNRMAELGMLLSSIVHEINNPLTVINSHSQTLERELRTHGEAWTKWADKAGRVTKMVERITRIVTGLRNMSGSGADDLRNVVMVSQLIDDVSSILEAKLRQAQVSLKVEIKSTDPVISCQPVQISQVLMNLISNSLDAVTNLEERWVKVEVVDGIDSLELWVMDSGPGIPEHVRLKLFDPFFTTKPVGKGTGLGLNISLDIMAKHKGKIECDVYQGHTRFRLILPRSSQGTSDQKAAA
jgi:C4-dicarboxylate-specific signal transduction histidine kinase